MTALVTRCIAILCVAFFLIPCAAIAEDDIDSGTYVLRGCRSFISAGRDDYLAQGICMGAVKAIIRTNPRVCRPKILTTDQAIRVIIAYIDSRPVRRHENFYGLAIEAMEHAWPCPTRAR